MTRFRFFLFSFSIVFIIFSCGRKPNKGKIQNFEILEHNVVVNDTIKEKFFIEDRSANLLDDVQWSILRDTGLSDGPNLNARVFWDKGKEKILYFDEKNGGYILKEKK